MIKAFIVDLDGTLLDSMHIWDGLATDYIITKGKQPLESRDSLTNYLATYTMIESANELKKRYDLHETVEEIIKELQVMIADKYANEVTLKKGVQEFITTCKKYKIVLCVLTASDYKNAYAALQHNGIENEFNFVMSVEEYMLSKRDSKIFLKAQEKLNIKKEDCVVLEDALYAIKSAKKANFKVYGMYDKSSHSEWNQIKKQADKTFNDFNELEEWICKQF